jgi:hypothetical protein
MHRGTSDIRVGRGIVAGIKAGIVAGILIRKEATMIQTGIQEVGIETGIGELAYNSSMVKYI